MLLNNMITFLSVALSLFTMSSAQSFKVWNVSLPFNMDDFGVGVFDNTLTVINGEARQKSNNDRVNLTSTYSLPLSPLSSTWTNNSNINIPFYSYQITYSTSTTVQINNLMYGIAPFISDPFGNLYSYKSMLIYNLKTNSYQKISTYNYSLPYSMVWHCVVTDKRLIYSIGGGSQVMLNTTSIYNINDAFWYNGSPINIARSAAGCSFDISSEYIYLFTGLQGRGVNKTKTIEKYEVMSDKWSVLDGVTMPFSVYFPLCILYPFDANIYCIGGDSSGTNGWSDYVQIFNTTDHSFTVTHLNVRRSSMNVVIYDNQCMIVLGGYGNNGLLNSCETLNCDWKPKTECSWLTNDGKHLLNLTDVSGTTISGTSGEFIYGYTPCMNQLLCNNTNVMAFELNIKSLICTHELGIWQSTTNNIPSYDIQNTTWQFIYVTKGQCNGNDILFEIYWICNPNAGLYNLLQSTQMGICTYLMEIESELACN